MRKASLIEKVIENDHLQAVVGAVGIAAAQGGSVEGGLVAQITGLLLNTASGMTFRGRIEEHLAELASELSALKDGVHQMTLAQSKFTLETFNTLIRTVEEEKLEFLRNAIRNAIADADLQQSEAAILARVIRDISAEEIAFLIRLHGADVVAFAIPGQATALSSDNSGKLESVYEITGTDSERLLITGLMSLGLASKLNVRSERFALNPVSRRLVALVAGSSQTISPSAETDR